MSFNKLLCSILSPKLFVAFNTAIFADAKLVAPVPPLATGTVGKLSEPTAPPRVSKDTSTMLVPYAYSK